MVNTTIHVVSIRSSKMIDYKCSLIEILDTDGGRLIVAYNVKKSCICTWNQDYTLQIWEETFESSYETIWRFVASKELKEDPTFQEAREYGMIFLNTHFHTDTSK
jgi:hypothetical protein